MYTIYYADHETPHETRIGMVSAPNSAIAHRVAEIQFTNSRIYKVMELFDKDSCCGKNNKVAYKKSEISTQNCRSCSKEGHEIDAIHCKYCGVILND